MPGQEKLCGETETVWKNQQKQLNAIKWFGKGKNSDKIAITDMSVHYTVEPIAAQYNDATHECEKNRGVYNIL